MIMKYIVLDTTKYNHKSSLNGSECNPAVRKSLEFRSRVKRTKNLTYLFQNIYNKLKRLLRLLSF
jgi:hypothetical protein